MRICVSPRAPAIWVVVRSSRPRRVGGAECPDLGRGKRGDCVTAWARAEKLVLTGAASCASRQTHRFCCGREIGEIVVGDGLQMCGGVKPCDLSCRERRPILWDPVSR